MISDYTNKINIERMIGMGEGENKYIEHVYTNLGSTNVCVSIWTNENTPCSWTTRLNVIEFNIPSGNL